MDNNSNIERLYRKIREEKVVLFIGSGFSLDAGAPDSEQIKKAIQQNCPDVKEGDLQSMSEDFVQRCGDSRERIIQVIQRLFPKHAKKSASHDALTRIPHIQTIYTTNYDSYLEDAYGDDKCCVLRNDIDLTTQDCKRICIYKMHGDFSSPQNIILTRSDYDDFFDRRKNPYMWMHLQTDMLRYHLLFIGYSVNDTNIMRLVQNIEQACNNSHKEMFMISPSIETYKLERLNKHHITWIQSTAQDFFENLENTLLDNVVKDYQHKVLSSNTFSRFCQIHDLDSYICEHEDLNEIERLLGRNGNTVKNTFNLTIRQKENPLSQLGQIKEDGPLKGKYGVKIPTENIVLLETRINGIRQLSKEDTQNLYILALPETKNVQIRIPSRNFVDEIKCEGQRVGINKSCFTFDLDICTFSMEITYSKEQDAIRYNVTTHIEMNDTYKSQRNALHWIELCDALGSGEKVEFPNIFGISFKISDSDNPFRRYKKYYQNIQEIEKLSKVAFTKYCNWTPAREDDVSRVLHYLKKENLVFEDNCREIEVSLDINTAGDVSALQSASDKDIFTFVFNKDCNNLRLNNHSFGKVYDYLVFEKCRIIKSLNKCDGQLRFVLRNMLPTYQEVLLKQPLWTGDKHKIIVHEIV